MSSLRVLVTGASGQLGQELMKLPAREELSIVGVSRSQLDITDADQCRRVLRECRPHVVIHCAAYTAVDQAEDDAEMAYRVNAEGTRNMVLAANEVGAAFCYVSTDYVFDGDGYRPYREDDPTNPQTVYGKTKLAGEQFVRSLSNAYFIVRTSWVFGRYGSNFVQTMLKLSSNRDRLRVVQDQVGSPTYTLDLAERLLDLVQTDRYGVYHISNTGTCSWYTFALAIFEYAGIRIEVEPCTTAEYPRPARRPKYSVLDQEALRANGFQALRPWREALQHYLRECGLRSERE